MTGLVVLMAGLALLDLAPMISANDRGQNKPQAIPDTRDVNSLFDQMKDRGMASIPRHFQFNDDDDHGSASPTPSPMATAAPTVDPSICSNGIIGIESSSGAVCCVTGCGQCGGVGCSTVGLPDYNAYDCCVTEILDIGMPCSVTGTAPCYIA